MQPCLKKKFTSWLKLNISNKIFLKGVSGQRNHHVVDLKLITKQGYQKHQDGLMINNLGIINVLLK